MDDGSLTASYKFIHSINSVKEKSKLTNRLLFSGVRSNG